MEPKYDKIAKTAMIFGICCFLSPIVFWISFGLLEVFSSNTILWISIFIPSILGVAGLFFSSVSRHSSGNGMAAAGKIFSIIGLILTLIYAYFVIMFLAMTGHGMF